MEKNDTFLECTTNGVPIIIAFSAIFIISPTPTGEAIINGMTTIDQKFSEVINTLDSLGVSRIPVK